MASASLHHGQAEHFGVTVAGQQHAAEHAQRGRLARAVGPEESVDAARGNVEVDVIDRDLVAELSRELPRGDRRRGGAVHGVPGSSDTSTGTPEGSVAASASSNTTSARKLSLRAVRGGERVVGRELRFAGDEAHLAAEFALDAIDAHRRRRADLHARAHRLGHVDARERRRGGEQHGHRGAARAGFSPTW